MRVGFLCVFVEPQLNDINCQHLSFKENIVHILKCRLKLVCQELYSLTVVIDLLPGVRNIFKAFQSRIQFQKHVQNTGLFSGKDSASVSAQMTQQVATGLCYKFTSSVSMSYICSMSIYQHNTICKVFFMQTQNRESFFLILLFLIVAILLTSDPLPFFA